VWRSIASAEGEVKKSTTIALALATSLSGSLAAYAQTERPTVHHHNHHQHHLARNPAPAPAPIAQRPGEESAPPQTNQMFKPYARPGEGDDDGLSRDPDDCMKGCIGGNPG
jgi:hypothetical protein